MNYTEKNKLMDRLCGIGLMLIFVVAFLEILVECLKGNMGMTLVASMPTITNVASGILLATGIVVLIFAYKKENYWRAGFGVELLVLAFSAMLIMHAAVDLPAPLNQFKWGFIFPIFFTVYYVIKAIYIVIKANRKR